METTRTLRRTAGFIARFFCNDLFKQVTDPRSEQGRRWKSSLSFLKTAAVGIAAGCKGLREVEELTEKMTPPMRKLIGIKRRMPDTTLRDYLCLLNPDELCRLIWTVGYDAWRRKALRQTGELPWGVVSLDAKYPTVRDVGEGEAGADPYLQVHHDKDTGLATYGLIRVITSVLITAVGRPLIGATPVPGDTNELGHFQQALGDLVRIYGRLFRVALYDAGAASRANADAVLAAGKHYFFQIADPNWVMYQTVELLLRDAAVVASTEEVRGPKRVVRRLSFLSVHETAKSLTLWRHTRTVFKVYSETYESGVLKGTKTRYYVSSLAATELPAERWLRLIVLRWGVETVHQLLDGAFAEDARPWITVNASGALSVMLLRRLVYTILTLYRSVTLRSDENREMSFAALMAQLRETLKWAGAEAIAALRARRFVLPPALA